MQKTLLGNKFNGNIFETFDFAFEIKILSCKSFELSEIDVGKVLSECRIKINFIKFLLFFFHTDDVNYKKYSLMIKQFYSTR